MTEDTLLKTLLKTSDKKSQIQSDLKGMEINHLLRPWSTCKVLLEISYAEFVSSVCHEHYDHPNNLRRLLRFGPCDGVSTVRGGVRKAGFKGGGGVELSFSGFCKIIALLI